MFMLIWSKEINESRKIEEHTLTFDTKHEAIAYYDKVCKLPKCFNVQIWEKIQWTE